MFAAHHSHAFCPRIATNSVSLISFARQVDQLMGSANKAAETAKQLDEVHDRAHTGKFLENTTYVIEQLHSIAVDIARIFQPSVEE